MKANMVAASAVLLGALVCGAPADGLQEGVRIEADGKAIDVQIGHLMPCVVDWNADGKKDLIVGQFSGGRIRLYLNQGTDAAPAFKDFQYLRADTKEIRLPAG